MAIISNITIEGFRSIRSLEGLALNRGLNVLIGANGAGKSNFIAFFDFLAALVNGRLQLVTQKAGGADRILFNGIKVTNSLRAVLVTTDHRYEIALEPTRGGGFVFTHERFVCAKVNNSAPKRIPYPKNGHIEAVAFEDGLKPGVTAEEFVTWKSYHFHDTSEFAGLKQPGDIGDNAALHRDAGNLAAFLYRLKTNHAASYRGIRESIRLIAPFFADFHLRPDPLNTRQIRLEWQSKKSEQLFSAHQLSDGTLRFICLATLLLQPQPPATIIIDEPELGLHPHALTVLGSLLRSAAQRTQVIASTQSIALLSEFSAGDIVVVDRENNQSVFKRLREQELDEWLGAYDLGELWEKNVFGGGPA